MKKISRYPGRLVDDELGRRLLRCYIYKFAKNNIVRKTKFDVFTKSRSDKKYYWFNTLRPIFGVHHIEKNIVGLNDFLCSGFLKNQENVFFLPQYRLEVPEVDRDSYAFSCSGGDVENFLHEWRSQDLQNITIFDSSFRWFVDIYEDLVPSYKNDVDVIVYFYTVDVKDKVLTN